MSAVCSNIQTPNPGLLSLVVAVDEKSLATLGGVLPAEGVFFNDAAWKSIFPRDYMKLYSGFRYVTQLSGGNGGVSLLFVKGMTEVERNTPYRRLTSNKPHPWNPILKSLIIHTNNNTPRAYRSTVNGQDTVSSGPSFYVRQSYVPQATAGSLFVQEFFFADVPWNIPQYPSPIASSVSYDLPGVKGGFPECLHDNITIPDVVSTTTETVGGTGLASTGNGGSGMEGQFFPRTNFKTWAPYVISDEQHLGPAGYERVRETVYPPKPPKTITN